MDMSVMKLVQKTIPFFITRIIVYGIFAVGSMIFIGIMIGIGFLLLKLFGESGGAFILVMVIALSVVLGVLRFVERYFLYMVKLGHVSVIVELLRTGEIPEGKGMIAYGKEKVTEHFGASNVAFVVDKMVHGAVKQIQRWIMRIGGFLKVVPGAQYIIGIVNAIMSVSLNYIDEAIMSYIFLRKTENRPETVWKSACDGVVLYAQSWKGILKAGAISVAFIYIFNIIIFLLFAFPFMFIGKMIAGDTEGLGLFFGFLALLAAYIITTMIKRAVVDPVVTIVMIRSYQMSIRGMEPAMDMQQKLLSVSSRFKNLFNKSEEEEKGAAGSVV